MCVCVQVLERVRKIMGFFPRSTAGGGLFARLLAPGSAWLSALFAPQPEGVYVSNLNITLMAYAHVCRGAYVWAAAVYVCVVFCCLLCAVAVALGV